MTAVFKKYKVCMTCLLVDSVSVLIHTFVSYIISLLEVFEEMCSKDEAYVA